MNLVLLVDRTMYNNLDVIKQHLKTKFKSLDYAEGFLDGYLFEGYKIMTLKEYENAVASSSKSIDYKWVIFIEIGEKEVSDEDN